MVDLRSDFGIEITPLLLWKKDVISLGLAKNGNIYNDKRNYL